MNQWLLCPSSQRPPYPHLLTVRLLTLPVFQGAFTVSSPLAKIGSTPAKSILSLVSTKSPGSGNTSGMRSPRSMPSTPRRRASRSWRRAGSGQEVSRRIRAPRRDSGRLQNSDDVLLEVLTQGDHFGAESFILGTPHTCELMATNECECLLLHRRPFQDLLRRFPQLIMGLKIW